MKRGFTIIELLVASLLLGILVTILTMIFNQSSLAWQVGVEGKAQMASVRSGVASVRDLADNAFVYDGRGYRVIGLWDSTGRLRNRACDAPDLNSSDASTIRQETTDMFFGLNPSANLNNFTPDKFQAKQIGSDRSGGSYQSLYVNVKSGGPKNDINHYQAIWSAPDDPTEWN